MATSPKPLPGFPIIDPHHHLWDFPGRTYLVPEMLKNTAEVPDLQATVFVQCGAMLRADGPQELRTLGETEFANGVAAAFASGLYGALRPCHRIVGQVDLTLGAAAGPVLDRHIAAAGERFAGARHITAWTEDASLLNPRNIVWPGMMADPRFRDGFTELARRGLVFDAWLLHPQLDELTALAQDYPDTVIVLDHLGGPIQTGRYKGTDNPVFAAWRAAMARLARCPNVVVKIGGLGMPLCGFDFHMRAVPPSADELAEAWSPYVLEAIGLFGARRCMFQSNFPVDAASCRYGDLWQAFGIMTEGMHAEDRRELFHGTAFRVYRFAG